MKVKENLEHILKELQDATFKIEEEQIENVLKLIAPDKKIFLTGKGRSGLAAKGFANTFVFYFLYSPKYLSNSPKNALPCLASSLHIS